MIYEKLEEETIESEKNKKNIAIYLNIFLFFLIDFAKDFGIQDFDNDFDIYDFVNDFDLKILD